MKSEARSEWMPDRPRTEEHRNIACPAPWVSLEFDLSGSVIACCTGHMYPLGRIGGHRLSEIWNGWL